AIQSLSHNGILPDLAVSMDPGKATGKVFNNVNLQDTSLFFIAQTYHEILEHKYKNIIYSSFTNDSVINYLFDRIPPEDKFNPTNTVTGTAIQFAKLIGAKTVVLAGQDLSFPDDQYYASGAGHV